MFSIKSKFKKVFAGLLMPALLFTWTPQSQNISAMDAAADERTTAANRVMEAKEVITRYYVKDGDSSRIRRQRTIATDRGVKILMQEELETVVVSSLLAGISSMLAGLGVKAIGGVVILSVGGVVSMAIGGTAVLTLGYLGSNYGNEPEAPKKYPIISPIKRIYDLWKINRGRGVVIEQWCDHENLDFGPMRTERIYAR